MMMGAVSMFLGTHSPVGVRRGACCSYVLTTTIINEVWPGILSRSWR